MTADRLTPQQWRSLAVSVYLPMALSTLGIGAVMPLLALRALELGASTAQAAFVVTLLGIGGLVGALPAGVIAGKFGEKRSLAGALFAEGVLFVAAYLAQNPVLYGLAVFAQGLVLALLAIARQGYLTEAVPIMYRARALSTLGGVMRLGAFVGPLAGAAVVTWRDMASAFVFAALMSVLAALVTLRVPDVQGSDPRASAKVAMWPVLRAHARTFATIGLGAAVLMLVRASRDVLLPLWANANGLDAAATSLIFAASSFVDLTLFYLGGSIMDRLGRRAVAVPAMVIMGVCFGLLPLTTTFATILTDAVMLGLGNGISSGVVMTLGSDASPAVGRPQFLAGWRLTTGLGQAGGPLLITAITAVAPLAWACVAVAAVGLIGAGWLWFWARPAASMAHSTD